MNDPNKTVFISYRRDVSKYLARSIFQDLIQNGYDAFLDVEKINSGSWESVILNQIAARTHFVLVLTPGTLDRCEEPNDMLRREIEQAMSLGRNIVLLLADNFEFKSVQKFLTGQLNKLDKYNGLPLPYEYFDEGMAKLRSRFLRAPDYSPILIPTPSKDLSQVQQIIAETTSQPVPTHQELSAEQFFSRGYDKDDKGDLAGAIEDFTKAIQLKNNYAEAYYSRGIVYGKKGELDAAIADYTKTISIDPKDADAYYNRGFIYDNKDELDAAISDYTKAIEINPELADVYYNRGLAYYKKSKFGPSISDYTKAIEIDPNDPDIYGNRGEAYFALRKIDDSFMDFKKTNELLPGDNFALAGLAITQHRLGNISEAQRLWKILISIDEGYKDAMWVQVTLKWHFTLRKEAEKLIAGL
jgi:tetratricopeptide (TPR) repeat protein